MPRRSSRPRTRPLTPREREESHAFLRAIQLASDDPAPRLLYADWLEERGDASRVSRAKAIRWANEPRSFVDEPARPDHGEGATHWIREWSDCWESDFDLAPGEVILSWTGGFPAGLNARRPPEMGADSVASVWRFAERLEVTVGLDDEERFAAWADASSFAAPRSLALTGFGAADGTLARLLASPRANRLESLEFHGGEVTVAGIVASLASRVPLGLRSLHLSRASLRGAPWALITESPAFANLQELVLDGCDLDDDDAEALARALPTGLRKLRLHGRQRLTEAGRATLSAMARCETSFFLPRRHAEPHADWSPELEEMWLGGFIADDVPPRRDPG